MTTETDRQEVMPVRPDPSFVDVWDDPTIQPGRPKGMVKERNPIAHITATGVPQGVSAGGSSGYVELTFSDT
ncbi:MAG: hypothetical protein M3198_01510 [Actinomycetota bacterium]|nr:hypothetical protein [Actinomycetota bacterium]